MRRRVVISGLGAVTGLGVGAAPLWEGLLAGKSSLTRISRFDPAGFPCRLASEVKDFSAKDFVPKSYRKAVKVMARDIELAVGAAKCAVEDAGLTTRGSLPEGATTPLSYPSERMGCHIGAGVIAAETEELTAALATARHPDGRFDLTAWGSGDGGRGGMINLPPLWLLKYLPNMLACHVTIIHGAEGPSNTITCAEASGLLSIGESLRVIERDAADLCFSGSAESKVNLMGLLRLDLAGRVAKTGDETEGWKIVRPFDPAGPGGLIGEAGGIVILEEADKAAARGAKVYAEVAGFGAAHSPHGAGADPDLGLQDAVESALADASISADKIDAILPLALGVPNLDAAEAGALRAVFGARLARIPLVILTPAIGNGAAGHGGVCAAVGALCVRHQCLPARLHAGEPAPGLDAGAAPSTPALLNHVLVCSSSLGGQNAAVVLRRIA